MMTSNTKEYNRAWYLKNKEKTAIRKKDWKKRNKEKVKLSHKKYYLKNKEKIAIRKKDWKKRNKEKVKLHDKKYYLKNKEKRMEYQRKYRSIHHPIRQKAHREYNKKYYFKNKERLSKNNTRNARERRRTNPSFRILSTLRCRVLHALKGKNKSASTMNLLGVKNIEIVWQRLESLFQDGMTRENHGMWHIDHITPCTAFDLTDSRQQRVCFHYTNLQPLWAIDNMRKSNKIIHGDITSPKM